eukprot:5817069-Amphidinium_carterae.1
MVENGSAYTSPLGLGVDLEVHASPLNSAMDAGFLDGVLDAGWEFAVDEVHSELSKSEVADLNTKKGIYEDGVVNAKNKVHYEEGVVNGDILQEEAVDENVEWAPQTKVVIQG